jgi:hypothetical protein
MTSAQSRKLRDHFHSLIDGLGIVYGLSNEFDDDSEPAGLSCLSVELGVNLPVILLSHDPGHSMEAYLVALHEVAHLNILRDGDEWDVERADHITQADREALAWSWTIAESIVRPNQADYAGILARLLTYSSPKWHQLVDELTYLTNVQESATRARVS